MIELNVDGQKVEVEDGASVLDATRKAKIFVPTLCYQRDLSSFGGCRMCMVSIEGIPGFPTACASSTPAPSVRRAAGRRRWCAASGR